MILNLIDSSEDSTTYFRKIKPSRTNQARLTNTQRQKHAHLSPKPCPYQYSNPSYPPAIPVYKSVKGGKLILSRGYIIFCTDWSKLRSGCTYKCWNQVQRQQNRTYQYLPNPPFHYSIPRYEIVSSDSMVAVIIDEAYISPHIPHSASSTLVKLNHITSFPRES